MSNRPPIPPEIATVLRKHAGWQYWRGIGGLYYARRPKTSPPVVLRAGLPADLAAQIEQWEAERLR